MILSKKEITELVRLVGLTRTKEIDCDTCLAHIAEFAECQLAGKSLAEGLAAVEQHLNICTECREDYAILRRVLENIDN